MYIVIGKHQNGKWYSLNTGPIDESAAKFQADVQSMLRRCETKVVKYKPGQYSRWPLAG